MNESKKKFLKSIKQPSLSKTDIILRRSAVQALKHTAKKYRFKVKPPVNINRESFINYINKLLDAIEARVVLMQVHLSLQVSDVFKFISISGKFYSQKDHLERDLQELEKYKEAVMKYKL